MRRLKIAFFGASVTEQKTGYAAVFQASNVSIDSQVWGYGARHLKDAGIIYLDQVLATAPDFVLLDWFSTGFIQVEQIAKIRTCIDTVVRKCIDAGARPVFMFFPQIDDVQAVYALLRDYLNLLGVPFIDIDARITDKSTVLRDSVHTNDHGSAQYAELIGQWLGEHYLHYPTTLRVPARNAYCDICALPLNLVVTDRLALRGQARVIGISQVVGPHSGYVLLGNYLTNNWDPWCHYEREMIQFDFVVPPEGIVLRVLQHEFDRSACKLSREWPIQKTLMLRTAYFIGATLELIDAS